MEEKNTAHDADSDNEEFQLNVIQPPTTTEEEPVTEIEHIHYEDDGNQAASDSDDST